MEPDSEITGKSLGKNSIRSVSQRLPTALFVVASVLPFLLIPAAHLVSNPATATGFYNEELPYYVANGRSAFDRGNGFLYPNPYDPDPAAPTIYFHWLLWCYGFVVVQLGVDPGLMIILATVISGLLFAAATWKLVAYCCHRAGSPEDGPWIRLLFLLSMWGGGLLVPAGLFASLLGVNDPISIPLRFDPFYGLWFLTWGRNVFFATESTYHILAAMCWLSEMRGKRLAGTLWCLALATTHPWSGLELLLTLNLWRAVDWIRHRDRASLIWLLAVMAMLITFLGYYKLWLPQFPNHQKLEHVWELDWSLSWTSATFGYALVLIPVIMRVRDRSSVWNSNVDGFLFCALLAATGLVFHDRLIRPVQPLHFTRGYIWMPLFLLGLPALQNAMDGIHIAAERWKILLVGTLALSLLDNAAFISTYTRWLGTAARGYHLDQSDRAAMALLHSRFRGAVFLANRQPFNYLAATYADVRPWLGHPFNTPDMKQRLATLQQVFEKDRVAPDAIADDIQVLLVPAEFSVDDLKASGAWMEVSADNAKWRIWQRSDSTQSAKGVP
jgi:hypothetical protein